MDSPNYQSPHHLHNLYSGLESAAFLTPLPLTAASGSGDERYVGYIALALIIGTIAAFCGGACVHNRDKGKTMRDMAKSRGAKDSDLDNLGT